MQKVYKRKFKGKTQSEVSAEMSRVACGKARRMTKQERTAEMERMVAARGYGHFEKGKYVRH